MNEILNAIRGSLLGGAAGDALGYPVEFMSRAAILKQYGKSGIRAYALDPLRGLALVSDDTQMTFFTASGLLDAMERGGQGPASGRFIPAVYKAYLDWYSTQTGELPEEPASRILSRPELHALRAPGCTCMSALGSGRMGTLAAPVNNSKGCGGVMRVAPVGLLYPEAEGGALLELDRLGAETAAITHGHPMGFIPAAFLTHAVHEAAFRREKPLRTVVEQALEAAGALFPGEKSLPAFQALIGRAMALAASPGDDADNIHSLGGGWAGDEAAAIGVYCALRYENDFSEALTAAVNHSGDSDSTGAVTGNLLGARLGGQAVAERWLDKLELADLALSLAGELYRRCLR